MNESENHFCDDPQEGARVGLLALMTGISEGLYCAGWMTGLEHACWEAREHGSVPYGMGSITLRQADLLRLLSEEADGWWAWDDSKGAVFVPLDEWRARGVTIREGEA